ncbi:hypothetical protein HZA44_01675 [Candidatus Peregrinibacteria bacterium]|nr:hypothetical protein [Candidatus Peregrinibacteria bacterium]
MIKRATCITWAKWFEKHEGVRISDVTIRNRLKVARKIGAEGRDRMRHVLDKSYFSEADVREVCADLLESGLVQVSPDGFVDIDLIRHRTISALVRLLGISQPTIKFRIKSSGLKPVCGKGRSGRPCNLYSELEVRKLCANLLEPNLIVVDSGGLAMVEGVCHGTIPALARLLGVSIKVIKFRILSSGIKAIHGKDSMGHPGELYPEPAVRELCADRLNPGLIQIGDDGFVEIGGIRHGTKESFARRFKISASTIALRLASSGLVSVKGRNVTGNLVDLFPEPEIRKLCDDLLNPELVRFIPSSFIEINGINHGTIKMFSLMLGISRATIKSRLGISGTKPVCGRDSHGNLCDLYPEPAVREACKDLLRRKKK